MNIFKILANGDGSINEPNVSAFLGYLLNPYADHGLGFEFLDSFLKQIEIQDEKFITLKYDYEIFFEQAFKEEDKSKQIVDIVILCINNNIGKQKESYVKSILSNDKKVEYIFLIENKINKASKTANQLKDQFDSTIIELSKIPELKIGNEKIYSIYITPKEKTLINEFNTFESSTKKHIYWKDEIETNESTLLKILKNIIDKEAKAETEAINEYTKHTIKSFIQFVENDFKSEKQEQKERKNDGSYIEKYKKLNIESQIEQKLSTLKQKLVERDEKFNNLLSDPDLTEQRFPFLCLNLENITIKIQAGASTRKTVSFLFQANKKLPNSKSKLKNISEYLNISIKKEKYDDAYCRTDEMQTQIPIDQYDEIFNKLIELINIVQNS